MQSTRNSYERGATRYRIIRTISTAGDRLFSHQGLKWLCRLCLLEYVQIYYVRIPSMYVRIDTTGRSFIYCFPLPAMNFVVFTCTYYPSTSDLRYVQFLETLQAAKKYAVRIVVVDGSPDGVHKALKEGYDGRNGAVIVRQTYQGGKGAALREAADVAAAGGRGAFEAGAETLLCWQEAEKTNQLSHWRKVMVALAAATDDGADVVVPRRTQQCFMDSYPIEQYHSETYGNLYLDTVMKDAIRGSDNDDMQLPIANTSTPRGISLIDWHFGPFAFRAKHIKLWSTYKGNSYDAQLVPIVHAIRRGLRVVSVDVDFVLDGRMREQEENNVDFIEKRLNQLNDLDPKVKASWTDDLYSIE